MLELREHLSQIGRQNTFAYIEGFVGGIALADSVGLPDRPALALTAIGTVGILDALRHLMLPGARDIFNPPSAIQD